MNVGIDITKTSRFEKLKDNDTFMKKVFSLSEIEYIKKKNYNTSTMAGLFAAKEAFLKAIKKGFNVYPLNEIEISHDENGAPFIINNFDLTSISLSISHDEDYAIAIVIIN